MITISSARRGSILARQETAQLPIKMPVPTKTSFISKVCRAKKHGKNQQNNEFFEREEKTGRENH